MPVFQLSARTRVWGSFLLLGVLLALGLAWLAAVGSDQRASSGVHRLTGDQVLGLVQPFAPQTLVGELTPRSRDSAVRP